MSIQYSPEYFVLDTISDSVLLLQNKCIRFANLNFEKMVGYSRTELIGMSTFPFFAPESAENFVKLIASPFENGSTNMLHLNHRTKGPLLIFVTLTKYEVNNYSGFFSSFQESSTSYISCIFKTYPREKEERRNWLEIFDEYSDLAASAVEFDEKENDFRHLFNSRKSMHMPVFKSVTSEKSNWVIKDAGFKPEESRNFHIPKLTFQLNFTLRATSSFDIRMKF
jgi:PAS domain S-box-containing protein